MRNETPVTSYCIGEWHYSNATGELRRCGEVRRLEPKAARVFDVLVARAGTLVTRSELFAAVWPNQIVVDEVLTRSISLIRKALNDASPYRYVQTLPKRGYRLVASVTREPAYAATLTIEPCRRIRRADVVACAGVNTLTCSEAVTRYKGTPEVLTSSASA